LVLFFWGFVFFWVWTKFSNPNIFPLNTAKIEGRFEHLEPHEIEKIIKPYVHRGFFTVSVSSVRQDLLEHPWVADASVSRVWPDVLRVRIVEEVPVAFWNNEGFLDKRGTLFKPVLKSIPAELPVLRGPENQEKVVLEHYQLMQDMVNSLGLRISWLEMSSRGAWELTLDNGMKLLLGRRDVVSRVRRFKGAYERVFGSRGSEVDYVDLRYTNGMAVNWKS